MKKPLEINIVTQSEWEEIVKDIEVEEVIVKDKIIKRILGIEEY